MTPEDRAEVTRRLEQEALLHAHRFEPVLPDSRELWVRDDELHTRSRALVVALAELAAGERGARLCASSLTTYSVNDEREERSD